MSAKKNKKSAKKNKQRTGGRRASAERLAQLKAKGRAKAQGKVQAELRQAAVADGKPVPIGDEEFVAEVLKSELPVLVDFWAPWCGPCKVIAPSVETIADEYQGRVKVVKYNTEEHQVVAKELNIRSIPALVFFKDGKVADVKVGAAPLPALKSWVDRSLQAKKPLLSRLLGRGA